MADFILWLFLVLRSGFLHSANAPVGMTERGDVCTNSPTVSRIFQVAPLLISQGCALPASPEGKLLYRDLGCRIFIGNSSVLKRAERHIGRSLRFRWWVGIFNQRILRTGGTALRIVETTGATVNLSSLTVGNGLCAVPLRGKYNLCGQPEPPIDMSFRANAVSRGIFPSGKFYLVVISCPTWWIPPLRLRYGRNDTIGGRFYEFAYSF